MNYLSIFLLGFVLLPQQGFKWVSFNMIQRINTQGKTTRMDSRVFFQSNGNMVTQISNPTEIFIFNNREGELRIYNPNENSVYKTVNYNYASLNNSFYYFLAQTPNMGLDQVGYKVSESKMDGNYLVTKWSPPAGLQADISGVELVSDGEKVREIAFRF